MLAVIFMQPAFRNFSDLIQYSEQVKILYFCSIRLVKAFNKSILCRLTQFNKFQRHTMLFRPLRQCQRRQPWFKYFGIASGAGYALANITFLYDENSVSVNNKYDEYVCGSMYALTCITSETAS